MTLRENVGIKIASWLLSTKGAPAPISTSTTVGNRIAVPQRTQYVEYVNEGYEKNPVVARCVGLRASTLSEAPIGVKMQDGSVNLNHPLAIRLRRPNDEMTYSQFMGVLSQYHDIGGNCYIVKERGVALGQIAGLWPYNDAQMAPVLNDLGWVEGYMYQVGTFKRFFPKSEVIHIRNTQYTDPLRPYMGESTVGHCMIDVDIYNELQATVYSLASTNMVPPGILKFTDPNANPSEEQVAQLKRQLQSKLRGNSADRGNPLVLAGMDYQAMGLDITKMSRGDVLNQLETTICSMFGVDVSVAGVWAGQVNSTYNNKSTAFREYTTLTRIPWWNAIEDQLEFGFQSEYPNIELEFDLSHVAALKSDPETVTYPAIALFDSDLATQNESRNIIGLPTREDGDKFKFELNPPVAFGVMSYDIGTTEEAVEGVDVLDGGTKRVRWNETKASQFQSVQESETAKAEKHFHAATVQMFKSAERQVLGKKNIKKITETLNLKQLLDEWMRTTGKAREELMRRMIDLAVQSVNGDLTSVISDVDKIRQDAERLVTSQINESLGTMQKDISAVLDANAGATEAVISKALTDKFDVMKTSRANTIARTTSKAQATTSLNSTWAKMSDKETNPSRKLVKVWLSQRDGDVREDHEEMDGVIAEMDGVFHMPNGDKMPRPAVGGSAENACNCRCTIRAVRRGNLDGAN